MPLQRAVLVEDLNLTHPAQIRFPMTESGRTLVWGEISDQELRRRAIDDGAGGPLDRRALFDRYRPLLEGLASEAYDVRGANEASDGALVVHVEF